MCNVGKNVWSYQCLSICKSINLWLHKCFHSWVPWIEHENPSASSHSYFKRLVFFCLFLFVFLHPGDLPPKHRSQRASLSPALPCWEISLFLLSRGNVSPQPWFSGQVLALRRWGSKNAPLWNNSPGSVIWVPLTFPSLMFPLSTILRRNGGILLLYFPPSLGG